jgi:PAS domain S-box-containing protein
VDSRMSEAHPGPDSRPMAEREHSVGKSEHESRLIADSIPGLVATFTPTGELEFGNRRLLEYFGKGPEELRAWESGRTTHPEDLPRVLERFTESIRSGEPFELEVRARRHDGVYRWFQSRGFPLRDEAGNVVRWFNLLIDIDDQKRAQTQLAGEMRLLEMVASGSSLQAILEACCRFVENASSDCQCGILFIDWNGLTLQKAAAPSLPDAYNAAIHGLPVRTETGPCARAACTKAQVIVANIETDPTWQGSAFRAVALANGLRSCWSTPIYSRSGLVLATFAVYQRVPGSPTPLQQELIAQVTHIASIAIERAESQAALERSEAFLAEAQRLSLTGSFFWRVATHEITWSQQAHRIFELDQSAPLTLESIETRVHPEDAASFRELVDRARRLGVDFDFEHRLLMPDQTVKYLHVVAYGRRDEAGQLEYIGAVQDVTERRVSEQALGRTRSELAHVSRVTSLGTLAASIAHEVNQPLSGIVTNTATCLRMLDADPPNVTGARETVMRTMRDSHRASEVVVRLRALFSKSEFARESLDLNEAMQEILALSRGDIQQNRIVLQAELADDLPKISGDRVQLQQVMLNLIRNAMDAMGEVHDRPRQLSIRTEKEAGDRVRLLVRDAGVGIDPEATSKIFEAFYTTKADGMGIGLSISRSIIERHEGRLWVEPNAGAGATFLLSVPCQRRV